jgi:hypothetical protein
VSLVVVTLFWGTTYKLRGSISDISNKKRINISSLFITADSVENNLSFNSFDSFLNILKIMFWFRFILYSYICYKESLVFQGFSLNYNISKIIIPKPKNKNFNNIIKLELPSIIRFINSILVIKNIKDITSRKVIFLK